jgi:Mg-chelatase subunit ChlD
MTLALFGCGTDSATASGDDGSGDVLDAGHAASKTDAGHAAVKPPPKTGTTSSSATGSSSSAGTAGSAGSNVCGSRIIMATANIPDMLIVLDASLSMAIFNRWSPSTMAVEMLTSQYQDVLSLGLEIFPQGGNSGCMPGTLDVPFALNNADKINAVINQTQPLGATPTGDSLVNALMYLGDRTQAADAPSVTPGYVLLVTDGEPDCPGADAVQAVTALSRANIKTYVVGYQIDGMGQDLMMQMAKAGNTDHFYPVESAADLQAAFADITSNLIRCEFDLAEAPTDPTFVQVTIDGKMVNLNAADGWVIDGKKVTLQGGSCAMLKDGAPHNLKAEVECDPVVVM